MVVVIAQPMKSQRLLPPESEAWLSLLSRKWRTLALAVWIIDPAFPVFRICRFLGDVKVLSVDRLCDFRVDGMHPFQVARNNLWGRLTRPFYSLRSAWHIATVILLNIEDDRCAYSTPKVALKFQRFVHVTTYL